MVFVYRGTVSLLFCIIRSSMTKTHKERLETESSTKDIFSTLLMPDACFLSYTTGVGDQSVGRKYFRLKTLLVSRQGIIGRQRHWKVNKIKIIFIFNFTFRISVWVPIILPVGFLRTGMKTR